MHRCYTIPFWSIWQSHITDMAAKNKIWQMSYVTRAIAELICGHSNLVWLIFGQKGYVLASNRENFAFSSSHDLQLLKIAVQLCKNLMNGDLICWNFCGVMVLGGCCQSAESIKHVTVTEGCWIDWNATVYYQTQRYWVQFMVEATHSRLRRLILPKKIFSLFCHSLPQYSM